MNVQHNLIQKLMLYKLKLDYNIAEVNKTFVVQKVKAKLITV